MLVERFAIVGADVDINANDFARRLARIQAFHYIEEAEHRCGENERSTVGYAGFDHKVWTCFRNELLKLDYILGVLNQRPSKALKVI